MLRISVRTALVAALALSLGGAASAASEAPFSFDEATGALPKTVVPLDYSITVVPDPQHLALTGRERVTIEVRKPTATIVFNALNLRFTSASVDGVPAASVVPNDTTQRTTLTTRATLTPGRHVLALAYRGKMETEPQGLFRQDYVAPGGKHGTMISTQFESTDARRMFPAWDEPAFRATYQLSAVLPAAWTTVSNMPIVSRVVHGATATTTFGRTPKMSSYLVVLSAGDLAHVDGVDANGTRHEVWAVRGQEQNGRYALANSEQILAAYDAYFGYKFPLPKLSSIAVPGGFLGAMENWGGITYNDQALLLPPTATIGQKQEVYATQAHEMAHQWFGDLVTMGWWDDLWLNESFASWMAARQTDRANPSWLWWQGQDADKERAMSADARLTSHPIQQHVANELEAEAAFDSDITYAKGQAFLRMTEAYLGPATFQKGIQTYIQARKFSNATGTDLWNALSAASGKDVAAYANRWIFQAGFPLVTVTASCDSAGNRTIALAQSRFLLAGNDEKNPSWEIPVGIASGSAVPHYTMLDARERGGIPAGRCDEPLRANAGDLGFYRVQYDAQTLATNQRHFGELPDDDKIAMLDDQWALVQAGKAQLGTYLALAKAMGGDTDARAWTQIAQTLAVIERDERGTPGHDAFTAYGREILAPIAATLGWDPKPSDAPPVIELRHTVLGELGQWGDPAAIAEAKKRFAAFVRDRSSLTPDDQGVVLTIVGSVADQATFDQLHALAKSAHDEAEMRRFYGALMDVRDPKLAEQAMQIAISSEIPAQAAQMKLFLVFGAANANPAQTYAFVKAHASALMASYSVMDRVFIAQAIPDVFWDAAPLDEVIAWDKSLALPGSDAYIARGAERGRFSVALKERIVPEADRAISAR
ncbi:MAG TPA: M1 family metallopeptidase [Candidatus Limnocylindria bacterium]|nr:M1 family metallopeptidase [Candidatus Limnocylindria bacterium]